MMEYSKAKKRKDILLPLFSRQAILDLQSLIQETVSTTYSSLIIDEEGGLNTTVAGQADKMCANISKQVEEGKTINIFNAYRCFALDGIASFCFGTSMNATEAPDLVSHMVEAMHASMPMTTLLRSFPTLQKVVTRTPGYITVFLQPQMKGLVDMRDVRTLTRLICFCLASLSVAVFRDIDDKGAGPEHPEEPGHLEGRPPSDYLP